MIDRHSIRRALAPLHASEDTIEEVLKMARHENTKRRYNPARRLIAIAAVIGVMAALCGMAYAVYELTMADRVVEEWTDQADGTVYTQYSPVGYEEGEASGEASADMTAEERTNAAPGSPEAQALAEWKEYELDKMEQMQLGEEDWGEMVPYEDPIRSTYGNAWSNDVAKIKEIAEKYDLRLYESVEHMSDIDVFYEAAGVTAFAPFAIGGAESSAINASVYDDGSFQLTSVRMPLPPEGEETVSVQVYRAMKGTFCHFMLLGDEAEAYTNETYTTADGATVELALGEMYSFIFAELDTCYVTFSVNGGTDPSPYLELLDMEGLQYVADSIDFSALG